jgi:hypothetical protein
MEEGWTPEGLTPGTAKKALSPLLSQLLRGPNRFIVQGPFLSNVPPGVDQGMVDYLTFVAHEWMDNQKGLEAAFMAAGAQVPITPQMEFTSEKLLKTWVPTVNASAVTHWLQDFKTLFFDGVPRVQFLFGPRGQLRNFYDLSMMNTFRILARFLFRGYVMDPARLTEMGNVTEFDTLYKDFRQVGVEIGLVDRRITDQAVSRFKEANMFLYHANGNEWLEVDEATELFATLVSTKYFADDMYYDLLDRCGHGPKDVVGMEQIPIGCFRDSFILGFPKLWKSQMPLFWDLFSDYSAEERLALHIGAESATFLYPRNLDRTHAEYIEHQCMAAFVQYIEFLFARYDLDNSGKFEVSEAFLALDQVFAKDLTKLSGFKKREDLQALFSYLLKYGTKPSAGQWIKWRYLGGRTDDFVADRVQVYKVLGSLRLAQDGQ